MDDWTTPFSWVTDRALWEQSVAEVRRLLGEEPPKRPDVLFTLGVPRYLSPGEANLLGYKRPQRERIRR